MPLSATTSETSNAMVYTYDYTENNAVDTSDARQLFVTTKNTNLAEATDMFRYDVNMDEAIDEADAQAYLDKLVGKNVDTVDFSEKVLKVDANSTAVVSVNVNPLSDPRCFRVLSSASVLGSDYSASVSSFPSSSCLRLTVATSAPGLLFLARPAPLLSL